MSLMKQFTILQGDKDILAWWEAQSNKSASLRKAVRLAIAFEEIGLSLDQVRDQVTLVDLSKKLEFVIHRLDTLSLTGVQVNVKGTTEGTESVEDAEYLDGLAF